MVFWSSLSSPSLGALSFFSLFPLIVAGLISFMSSSMMVMEWSLFLLGSFMFDFPLLVDKYSLVFMLTVSLITFSVMLFSVSYMSGDSNLEYFIYMVCLFVLSMNFLICVPNLIMLLLGWDGLGLTSYLLVIYYQNSKSMGAGMVTALSNRVGDALLILGGALSLSSSVLELSWLSFGSWGVICGLITVGAMTKSAQIPFSAWLPAAMAAPTPVSSLVHSSTLVTAGVYILIRFYSTLSEFWFFCPFVLFTGVLTCGMASLVANFEFDLKKIIALSTLSQLGVMMMSIGMGLCSVAFFHLITHALFKALLFVCAGTIIHVSNNMQDIRFLGNMWWDMPVVVSVFNVANLALCGFPFMAGFYSKDLILEMFLMGSYPLWTFLFSLATICLTAAYSVRLSMYLLWFPCKFQMRSVSDMSVVCHVSIGILFFGAVMGGAVGAWGLLPSVELVMLPVVMKVLGLILVFFLGGWAFSVSNSFTLLAGAAFMNSMWFLSIVTSNSSVQWGAGLSTVFCSSELSWLEVLGGKGLLSVTKEGVVMLQRGQNLSSSQLFSLFSVMLLIFLLV